MKRVQLFVKGKAGIIGAICLMAALFSSCVKDNNDDYVEPPAAFISVINALPGVQPVDFYIDQNRANNYAINYGSGQDYIRAYTGKRTPAFYLSGTQTKIISDTATLAVDKFYTLYLTGSTTTPEFLLLNDAVVKPAAGKATIRLVNVSPNAPAVDLAIKDGAVLVNNKGYKTFSPFVEVTGDGTYTLEVRQAGTITVLASITNVKLNTYTVNTVWLQGLTTATDDSRITAKLQTNAYYKN